jgi:hypothetical protein
MIAPSSCAAKMRQRGNTMAKTRLLCQSVIWLEIISIRV